MELKWEILLLVSRCKDFIESLRRSVQGSLGVTIVKRTIANHSLDNNASCAAPRWTINNKLVGV